MKLFKYLANPFVRLYHDRRKRHFRLTSDFGVFGKEVSTFRATAGIAQGKTIKAFAWHEADRADLEELIDGEWQHVATSPNPNITMDTCVQA